MVGEALPNRALLAASAAPAGVPSEDEYRTFSAVLSASGRGRAFLAEYARRHRGADTETLLAALARLETLMRAQRAGLEPAGAALRELLTIIRAARPEINASKLPARAARLAQLLDLLERRLEAMAAPAPPAAPPEPARLAVVPPPREPQLPIPSPAAVPVLTLAHERAAAPAPKPAPAIVAYLIVPEVTWLDGPPPGAAEFDDTDRHADDAVPSTADKVAALTPPLQAPPPEPLPPEAMPPEPAPADSKTEADLWALSTAKIAPPPPDPLAALYLLSEEERLALFT